MTDSTTPRSALVLGGMASGKSAFAEALCLDSGLRPIYLATGRAGDGEMAERIERHRRRRGDMWQTIEEPLDLETVLARNAGAGAIILVDCLTLWLTNLMMVERSIEPVAANLVACVGRLEGPVVFVSNEVGLGVVPMDAMSRAFVDHAGRLHQRLAAAVERVVLVSAGLPHQLKP
ncbi:MAG: bifunctional adenosylcobinamide kinase/adenosylcobinamide-phosphate guanylyltransferase [Geminicoccaceae bacterium]